MKNTLKKTFIGCLICITLISSLTGCSKTASNLNNTGIYTSITDLSIPEDADIVALGEATHGNKEYQDLKLEVFKKLVEQDGYRAFALESDFGGGQKINGYIQTGEESIEKAVEDLGFRLYKTEEMQSLLEWMRDYNQSNPEDMVRFYGFDVQRYDNSKEGLFTYLETVNAENMQTYKDALAPLNNDTVYTQDKKIVAETLKPLQNIIDDLTANKENYVQNSSELDYNMALNYANCLFTYATIRGTDVDYWNSRDKAMAENVKWIVQRERQIGNGKLFISGHNGHIEKTGSSMAGKTGMGKHLTDAFGGNYYAIGTEFSTSTYRVKDKSLTVNNKTALTKALSSIDANQLIVDFAHVEDETLTDAINKTIPMSSIGNQISFLYKFVPTLRQVKMIPTYSYDSLIYYNTVTPSTALLD